MSVLRLPDMFKMEDVPQGMLSSTVDKGDVIRDYFSLKKTKCPLGEEETHLSLEVRKHKRWEKKLKHNKDTNHLGKYLCKCEWCVDNKLHKNKKAQKVFTVNEYDLYHADHGEDYPYDSSSFWKDTYHWEDFTPCSMFPTEEDFLSEIGCDHLIKGAWREGWLEWEEEYIKFTPPNAFAIFFSK